MRCDSERAESSLTTDSASYNVLKVATKAVLAQVHTGTYKYIEVHVLVSCTFVATESCS